MTSDPMPSSSAENNVSAARVARETPSLLAANVYLLVGLLVLIWSSWGPHPLREQYLIGIAVEFALALGALLFQRIERLSIRKTLRLRWPGWRPTALSVALAFGLWMTGVILNVMTTMVLGYTAPAPPTLFPRNGLDALLLVFSTMVVAPLCEEVMFRGYVQRAYERRNPWTGILVGGIIFSLYHLRFQGAFALMPVALALGFVAWRSDSLLPGILLHAAYNSIATLVLVAISFLSMQIVTGLIIALICVGVLMSPVALLALWGIWRVTDPPVRRRPARFGWMRRWLWPVPIVVMLGIYGYAAVVEVIVGRFPEMLAVERLELRAPEAWDAPARWRYAIRGGLNQTVGEVVCDLLPRADEVELSCDVRQDVFEADLPFDVPGLSEFSVPGLSLAGEAFTLTQHVVWSRDGLQVRHVDGTQETAGDTTTLALTTDGQERLLAVGNAGGEETVTVPADVLLDGEWPWRLSALPFDIAYGGARVLAFVDDNGLAQVRDAFVVVRGGEPVWSPAGNFVTWKVTVTYDEGDDEITLTAWYDVEAPHTLIQYDNGEVSYLLEAVE